MSFCLCLISMPVSYFLFMAVLYCVIVACSFKGGYTLVTLPRNVSDVGYAVRLRACSVCCWYSAVASKGGYGYGLSRCGRAT